MLAKTRKNQLAGLYPVVQIDLKFIKIDDLSQIKNAEMFITDYEDANYIIDWFLCPVCEKTTYFLSKFDSNNNYFEEIERIYDELKQLKCIHCNTEFTYNENDDLVFIKNKKI